MFFRLREQVPSRQLSVFEQSDLARGFRTADDIAADRQTDADRRLQAARSRQCVSAARAMLHGASQKIADAHAQALAGMSLTDPELQAKCHAAERARDLMWAATVKQADTRFGYKHVSEALRGLGRRRATM